MKTVPFSLQPMLKPCYMTQCMQSPISACLLYICVSTLISMMRPCLIHVRLTPFCANIRGARKKFPRTNTPAFLTTASMTSKENCKNWPTESVHDPKYFFFVTNVGDKISWSVCPLYFFLPI